MRKTITLSLLTVLAGSLTGLAPQAQAAESDLSWSAEPTTAKGRTAGTETVGAATTEAPAAPPWGACGLSTDENKEVRTFSGTQRRLWVLRCGGPKHSSTPAWGYRHILWRHRGDFERMSAGTDQNWRDIADLSLDSIAKDPDRWADAGGGKECRSRLIYLINRRTGQVVRTQIVRQIAVFKGANSNDIITAYPASAQC
ncbi:hypothetical protein [Streptoalloteichus hindustanus]|uniref:Uncharacterized protein n=1 Tax=Streptoalloteichus hindustanus TaxID=2017 RepID=A0A1M5N9K5_STRHI|nr:hypothetical protein [Streptoalloteichus hindustanus]SHG86200.1 hypothetical protein SAMN05444320_11544 [Streptoalloteichus hindustanus]